MIARLVAVFALLLVTTAAYGQVGWSSAGAGCVPAGAIVSKYGNVGAAAIQHAAGKVGVLTFTCSMD